MKLYYKNDNPVVSQPLNLLLVQPDGREEEENTQRPEASFSPHITPSLNSPTPCSCLPAPALPLPLSSLLTLCSAPRCHLLAPKLHTPGLGFCLPFHGSVAAHQHHVSAAATSPALLFTNGPSSCAKRVLKLAVTPKRLHLKKLHA